jgi:ribonuclease J
MTKKQNQPPQKPTQDNRPVFAPDTLSFVPLGGSGQFGCNLNVYHCNGKFLIVDCGIGFPDERFPGMDTLLPDPGFLRDCAADIVGLVLTHAHDDHKAAIAPLWPQLQCPIYASPFAADLLRHQLNEWNLTKRAPLHDVPLGSVLNLDPFKIEYINTAHSVVESTMLYIKTPHGGVLHTGDWRIDDTPMEGSATDIKRLKELGNENLLAVIGDSTNANVTERHPSERELAEPIADVLKRSPGRVVVTTFSHSVPRMRSVSDAAKIARRQVGMIGRSMLKVQDVARKHGYLNDVPQFLNDKDIVALPPERVVLFATGSQGEPGSAMERLAYDTHQSVSLSSGDVVLFSAREIPGNEKAIERLRNALFKRGIRVIMPDDKFIHASGHAYADEIRELYEWTKPVTAIPVHGAEENQRACADLALKAGVQHTLIPENGDIIALRPTGPERTGQVTSSLMAVDGSRVIPVKDSLLLKERQRIANDGSIVATIVTDDEGFLLNDPVFSIIGVSADEIELSELEDVLMNDIDEAVNKADTAERMDAGRLRELVRLVIRRRVKQETGKRPMLSVHLVQLT